MTDSDRQSDAYARMLSRLREAVDMGASGLAAGLDTARAMAVRLGELTNEEAELVGRYLRRDLAALNRGLSRGGHALAEWLDFDLDMLEGELWSWLKGAADPTELAWLSGEGLPPAEAPEQETLRTGEICGLGTLACAACGQRVRFTKPGPIPPCPRCHKTVFSRLPESPA